MRNLRIIALVSASFVVVVLIMFLQLEKPERNNQEIVIIAPQATRLSSQEKAQHYSRAKEITTPDGFINVSAETGLPSGKVALGDIVGKKVILLDFWTYSCINCQRTTPYLNAWYEKYKDKGLVIIGVHTPEFEFEHKYNNVLAGVKKLGIKFPVVLDNDYSTWMAYQNQYWPHKYLIDIDGYIVYDHIGEGGYDETEAKIQELLKERDTVLSLDQQIPDDMAHPVVVSMTEGDVLSPETYFGAARNRYLANGKQGMVGVQDFKLPVDAKLNNLFFDGQWNIQQEFAESKSEQAKIRFRYHAKNVYFVAGSPKGVTVQIFKDGVLIGEQLIQENRLYPLIQDSESGEHTLELRIKNPGLQAFTFTFG